MAAHEDEIIALLADPDKALRVWYDRFMTTDDPELILAGEPVPSARRIAEIFDRWVRRSRDQIRRAVCPEYISLSQRNREIGEIGVIATVSTALGSLHFPIGVDPVVTAVILVSRRSLDDLCGGQPPTEPPTQPPPEPIESP